VRTHIHFHRKGADDAEEGSHSAGLSKPNSDGRSFKREGRTHRTRASCEKKKAEKKQNSRLSREMEKGQRAPRRIVKGGPRNSEKRKGDAVKEGTLDCQDRNLKLQGPGTKNIRRSGLQKKRGQEKPIFEETKEEEKRPQDDLGVSTLAL